MVMWVQRAACSLSCCPCEPAGSWLNSLEWAHGPFLLVANSPTLYRLRTRLLQNGHQIATADLAGKLTVVA